MITSNNIHVHPDFTKYISLPFPIFHPISDHLVNFWLYEVFWDIWSRIIGQSFQLR